MPSDDITTVLKFIGEPQSALAAINAITEALRRAGQDAAANTERFSRPAREGRDASLAFAQAQARLQQAQGNLAAATDTLKTALASANQNTIQAVRAQTQLVGIQAQLSTAASKAETQILREAQALARLQQIAGNTPAAIKTLSDALNQVSNRGSLAAIRAELQKTYLTTNYNNSPLIGAIRNINAGLAAGRPLLGQFGAGLQQITGLAGSAASGLGSTTVALGAVGIAVAAIAAGFGALVATGSQAVSVLQSIGEAGIAANAQIETLRIGITTVIASVADIRNSDGIQLKGIDALNAALPVAADQLRKLRIDALETSATLADIAPAFQAAIGPGLAAGLTIDQIRENTIKLTQAVTSLGLPLDQIKQETRAILAGDINRTTQAAIALGITRQAVEEAKKQGKFAEFLEEKLSAAAAAGKLVAETFAAAQSNLKEAGDTFQAVVTEGLFDQLRDTINKIIPQIFDKKQANLISKNFEGISDTLTRIFDTAGRTISDLITFIFNGLKQISQFLEDNQATVGTIVAAVDEIVRLIGQTIADIAQIVFGAMDAGDQFDNISRILKGILIVTGAFSDSLKISISLIGVLGNAIRLAVLLPLEGALRLLSAFVALIPGASAAVDLIRKQVTEARQAATEGVVDSAKNFGKAVSEIGQSTAAALKRIEDARKRAALGARAVSGLNRGRLGEGENTFKPPKPPKDEDKKAAEAARRQAAAELKILQQKEKQIELNARRESEALKTSLEDRLISLEFFTEQVIEVDRQLLQAKLATLEEEEKAAIRTAKTRTEQDAKRAEFELKRNQAIQETDLRTEALRDDLRRKQEKAEEDHLKRLADIRETARKSQQDLISEQVRSGNLGEVAGEEALLEIERERLAERKALLDAEFVLARENLQERQRVSDELAKLAAERAAFEIEASGRIREAQKKEAEEFRDFTAQRINALIELKREEIATQAARSALALQRGKLRPRDAEQQEFDRRRELIRIESLDRERQIEREAEQLVRQAKEAQQGAAILLEIERQKNAALKAERDRASAEQQAVIDQKRAALLAPEVGQDAALVIAGIESALERQLTLFERLRIETAVTAQSLRESLEPIGAVFIATKDAIVSSLSESIAAFVSGRATIRQAAASLYAAALQPLKDYLLKKARAEFAIALADAAIGNFAGAAKHAIAGTALSAAAGLIDAGGSAIAGSGGGATGGAISAGGGGAASTGPRLITQNSIQGPQQERLVIVLRTDTGVVVDSVVRDFQNNGRSRTVVRRDSGDD